MFFSVPAKRKMTVLYEWVAGTRLGGWVQRCRESRRLVLVIVAIALLLDNMLLTTVGKLIALKVKIYTNDAKAGLFR